MHYAPFRPDATKLFRIHNGRVKDIGTSWGVPKVFWSVAEDGVVFQFDVRVLPKTDGRCETHDASGVVVRLGRDRRGKVLRGMGMATHPLDPTKFVLACGDYYTRLFDHRMLRLEPPTRGRSSSDARATVPVQVFAPPHLHLNTFSDRRAKLRHDEAHGTSIQFSSDGAQVLTNYHNDHIYLFQVAPTRDADAVIECERPECLPSQSQPIWRAGAHMDEAMRPLALPTSDVRELHSQGLVALLARNYVRALKAFTTACSARVLSSMASSFRKELLHHCAKAYLGRAWSCDAYLAAVYCKRALALDATDRSVELTYIRALHTDKKTAHCRVVAQAYAAKHRAHASDVEQYLDASSSPQTNNQQQRDAVYATPPSSTSDASNSDDDDDDDNNDNDHSHESPARADTANDEDADADASSSSSDDEHGDSDDASVKSDSSPPHSPPTPSLPSFPETDDAFWTSRDVLGQAVTCDVVHRYIGYCNNETDIKEAAFFGPNDAFIVAGSDDGRAYVWHTATGRLVNAIAADETIVNCVRPHPFDTCLATSGIEDVIRLWSPTGDADLAPSADDLDAMTSANQRRMANDNWSFYFGGVERDVIRVVFQPTGREGVQECATS